MRSPMFRLLMVGSISVAACGNPEVENNRVAVFVDLTEVEQHGGTTQLEDSVYIEDILDLIVNIEDDSKSLNGAEISFYTMGDESILRRRYRNSLPIGKKGINRLNRRDELIAFRNTVRVRAAALVEEIVNEWVSTTPDIDGYGQSHIVRPICEYLRTATSGTTADVVASNYLIIFSDLLENSEVYKYYSSEPEEDALEALSGACSAVQVTHKIEYQVLQQPLPSGATEVQFRALQTWTKLFEQLGLTENPNLLN
jgi:hypothetical protein